MIRTVDSERVCAIVLGSGWDDFLDSMPGSHPHDFNDEDACGGFIGDKQECNVIGCGRAYSHPIHRT